MIFAQFPLWKHKFNNKAILKIDETIWLLTAKIKSWAYRENDK